jgi:AraC-like DNA-binding protein
MTEDANIFADRPDALSPVLDMIRLRGGRVTCTELASDLSLIGPMLVLIHEGRGQVGEHDLVQGDLAILMDGEALLTPIGNTHVMIGEFRLDRTVAKHLLVVLPNLFVLHGRHGRPVRWLDKTSEALVEETERNAPGVEVVVSRLLDTVLVRAMRDWAATNGRESWLAGATDPRIGRVLAHIHRNPGSDLDLASLAELAGMSRTGFTNAFREKVGYSPGAYVNCWRMDRAAALLRDGNTVGSVANSVGYSSAAAFSRAFSSHVGVAPERWRRDNSS